jgi:hypothetical protein
MGPLISISSGFSCATPYAGLPAGTPANPYCRVLTLIASLTKPALATPFSAPAKPLSFSVFLSETFGVDVAF